MTRFKIVQENPLIEMIKLDQPRSVDGGETAGTVPVEKPSHFVLVGDKRISRLEAEAADSVNFSLILFLVFIMLPSIVLYAISSVCIQMLNVSETCIPYAWYFFYTSTFLNAFYSGILNVLLFVLYNHDLRSLYSTRRTP